MKKSFYLQCLALMCLTISCKKSKVAPEVSLTGKWKVVSSYESTWGGGQWHDLTGDKNIYLEFKTDGTLTGNDLASFYSTYIVKDSATLTLTTNDGSETRDYSYQINSNFLTISPKGPMYYCVGSCGTKCIKQ
nr:hypothetical protein [uncultured Mucilaginibacter sp.]